MDRYKYEHTLVEPDRSDGLMFNAIPEQNLTYANQLTLQKWNEYISVLKEQANTLVAYAKRLNEWLCGDSGFFDIISSNFNETLRFINDEYIERINSEKYIKEDISVLLNLYGTYKLDDVFYLDNDDVPVALYAV